ncbi:MarR family winged helix-turn-helix transcriptional regulator [Dyadobacter arcticus]|uniref:DNA-binding MarR family transcriptional regulator n=1 Tax=Dyadobacter arcticus TaxID=1078754 RepID=A0ABX0UKN4_9BACT|nr:MarR family winged helix-turn-helix transcriptional regulator [Dyadobacter arcticus]NIJ52240.1 DNA-binding MarR family transcriptional regulator [Dyadobacter arcticus]
MTDTQLLLGNRLGALANAISDRLQRDLIPTQTVGNSQLSVLVILHSFPGATVEDMSQALDLSHSNLVRVVEQLRQMALLEKKRGKDSRSNALFIAPAGENILTDFYRQRDTQMQTVLNVLTGDEQRTLAALVNKMLTNFPDGHENDGRICRYCDIDLCSRADCPMHTQDDAFSTH